MVHHCEHGKLCRSRGFRIGSHSWVGSGSPNWRACSTARSFELCPRTVSTWFAPQIRCYSAVHGSEQRISIRCFRLKRLMKLVAHPSVFPLLSSESTGSAFRKISENSGIQGRGGRNHLRSRGCASPRLIFAIVLPRVTAAVVQAQSSPSCRGARLERRRHG